MKFLFPLILIVALFFNGCGTYPVENNNGLIKQELSESEFLIIGGSDIPYDGIYAKKEYMIFYSNDLEDVENFSKEYYKLTADEAPKFNGTMIIVKRGYQTTGGYGIDVENIINNSDFLQVNLIFSSPGKNCLVTEALTNPFIIIYIPNNFKDVVFSKKYIETKC